MVVVEVGMVRLMDGFGIMVGYISASRSSSKPTKPYAVPEYPPAYLMSQRLMRPY